MSSERSSGEQHLLPPAGSFAGQPCRFDTNGSASGAAEDVTLRLTPLSQAVKVRVELGAVGIRGAQHWATGLASIDAVRYEVRHRRLDAVVLTGQFAAPSVTPLAHPGQLFIGEEYSITTLEGSLFHAATTFRVGAQPIEVVLRGALREAGLLVVFESANGKALPPGIQYRVRSTRAACALTVSTSSRAEASRPRRRQSGTTGTRVGSLWAWTAVATRGISWTPSRATCAPT